MTSSNHFTPPRQVQTLEKEIVTILSDADPLELNYMLPKIGLGLLFYKIKDHVPTNMHRTRLLDLLAVTRVAVSYVNAVPAINGSELSHPMIADGGAGAQIFALDSRVLGSVMYNDSPLFSFFFHCVCDLFPSSGRIHSLWRSTNASCFPALARRIVIEGFDRHSGI